MTREELNAAVSATILDGSASPFRPTLRRNGWYHGGMKKLFVYLGFLFALSVSVAPAFDPPCATPPASSHADTPTLTVCEPANTAGAVALTGCTPKREAATAEIAQKKAKCITDEMIANPDRTPEQVLLKCAIPRDADDYKNLWDLIVGMQVVAINAGASLPNAAVATGLAHPSVKDAGGAR